MTGEAYITGLGRYLPGPPIDNDQIASRLGGTDQRTERIRQRILAANGIRQRHYALAEGGEPTELNEQLAAKAVEAALADRGIGAEQLQMLACATTQGDLLVPGFASMVHGRLGGGPMQLLSSAGVCTASLSALDAAVAKIKLGDHDRAAVVGSEAAGRWLRQSRFDGIKGDLDAHFLRWMLSDGAGAAVIESEPRSDAMSLRVDWVRHVSLAHEHPVCMRAGLDGTDPVVGRTWQDYGDVATAEKAGLMQLRQETRVLQDLAEVGLQQFERLVDERLINLNHLDHVLCHYSTNAFRDLAFDELAKRVPNLDTGRWFSNLETCGNTGTASILIALEEAWRTGLFRVGDSVLLAVPESGRFSFAFAHLTAVGPARAAATTTIEEKGKPMETTPTVAAPVERTPEPDTADLASRLAAVWTDFEARLAQVPVLRRLDEGTATLTDYQRLLYNLRQQVVDGARWISRAASNFEVEYFDLRSAAIAHAEEEHRDFLLLERNYVACGGSLADITSGRKNIGSEALSGYMFHQASLSNPIGLLGAMFIIEGLGTHKAFSWAVRFQEVLGLSDDQVSFMRYHGEADDDHFAKLQSMLNSDRIDAAAADRIVTCAKVVARLYVMQLEELDHV